MATASKMELLRKRIWMSAYWLSIAVFLLLVANFYKPGCGFTGLIEFGDHFSTKSIAGLHCVVEPNSAGYDGQFYAKLSLDPLLLHASNDEHEVDDLYYRSRRILMSWTAWMLGLGRPAWIMQVYALQNVACWLALAWLLTRWFPPLDFNNYARWAGILFSFGLMHSVRSSLTDGPVLLLVALGLAFCEGNRCKWASGMFAMAGLTRETSLLALASLADPAKRSLREISRVAVLCLLAIAPLACWMVYLMLHLPHPEGAAGTDNFSLPLVAWARKWASIFPLLGKNHWAWQMGLLQLAISLQAFFLLLRPEVSKPAWRLGAMFALLTLCLGGSVWEGFPGAAGRTVLPMLLAFNLLVPRGRWWLALLVAGNMTVAIQPLVETSVPGDVGTISISSPALDADEAALSIQFGAGWYKGERGFLQTWRRWSSGSATVTIQNSHDFALVADLGMSLSAKRNDNRAVAVELNGREIWSGTLTDRLASASAPSVRLEPGANTLVFKTADVTLADSGERRPLAFCLRDLEVTVRAVAKP